MASTLTKVLVMDIVAVAAGALVTQNLLWMLSYAGSPHADVQGYGASFGFGPLYHAFSMAGGPLTLQSPPTLDWIQVIILVLLAINGWYLLSVRKWRPKTGARKPSEPPLPSPPST